MDRPGSWLCHLREASSLLDAEAYFGFPKQTFEIGSAPLGQAVAYFPVALLLEVNHAGFHP